MLNGKVVLVTGGTGSFGNKFVERILVEYNPQKIIIYSRDEFKQDLMRKNFISKYGIEKAQKLRFFIGDVRDKERLYRAFNGVDYVIHAAAMKQVPACEYNPFEAIKTNINGAENIVEAAIDRKVKKVIALSTDKAVNPINLYGGTKLVSDKLFISANAYSGEEGTIFSVVRYGNVAGSRGSVIPFFKQLLEQGEKELNPNGTIKEVGIREGEKIHEVMITRDDANFTYDYGDYYVIYPNFEWWSKEKIKSGGILIPKDWDYNSGTNGIWLEADELRKRIATLDIKD